MWDEKYNWGYDLNEVTHTSCEHEWGDETLIETGRNDGDRSRLSTGSYNGGGEDKYYVGKQTGSQGQFCLKCGAWRGSLGLEPTPKLYISHLVQIFREVRRVLRSDGTVWLNLGDSYARDGGPVNHPGSTSKVGKGQTHDLRKSQMAPAGLKPKDLCGIPWRVALALQADGWWLRSDIIWNKPNPMPESVTDRPTRSHEYMFLLTKSAKYFYDAEAVREPSQDFDNKRTINPDGSEQIRKAWKDHKNRDPKKDLASWGSKYGSIVPAAGRNKRTVWTIPTQPFSGWTQTSRLVRVAPDEVSCGMKHIVSPYCPEHGGLFDQVSSDFCGEYVADWLNRIKRMRNYLFSAQPSDSVPIDLNLLKENAQQNLDLIYLECFPFAIDHNSKSHKKALSLLTNPSYNSFVEILSHTDDKLELLWFFALQTSIHDNNILPGEMGAHLLDRIPHRIVDNISLPSPPYCLCQYYQVINQESSHFATFPEKLVEPCILAGTSQKGCCPECGAPWVRVVEKSYKPHWKGGTVGPKGSAKGMQSKESTQPRLELESKTIGWRTACECFSNYGISKYTEITSPVWKAIPCTVLDPFFGSGTVALVAEKLGRKWVGIELSSEYCEMARKRIEPHTKQRKLF